jgi:hypothetical protein
MTRHCGRQLVGRTGPPRALLPRTGSGGRKLGVVGKQDRAGDRAVVTVSLSETSRPAAEAVWRREWTHACFQGWAV